MDRLGAHGFWGYSPAIDAVDVIKRRRAAADEGNGKEGTTSRCKVLQVSLRDKKTTENANAKTDETQRNANSICASCHELVVETSSLFQLIYCFIRNSRIAATAGIC